MNNKGRNYMYSFSALGINCMLCLSSRTWNGHVMFMYVYSLRHFGGGACTRQHGHILKLVKATVVHAPIPTRAHPPSTPVSAPSLPCMPPLHPCAPSHSRACPLVSCSHPPPYRAHPPCSRARPPLLPCAPLH
jgi:hypothetical protein